MAETTAPQKKKKILSFAIPIALIVLVLGVLLYRHASRFESTDDAFIDSHIVSISPKVAGQVTQVNIDDNQVVKAGDVLFEIDPRDYEAKAAEQRAKVASAEAEANRATSDAKRYTEIYAKDEVSKQQLDLANATAQSARAALESARATAATADLNLSYTKAIAPQSGRITRKNVTAGDYVQVGQPLLSIVPDHIWVTANFKETQLTHMRAGQPVTIKVDAYPGRVLHGHVDSVQSGTGERFSLLPPENATGNYVKVVQRVPVKIEFDQGEDPNVLLAPGMSVVPTVQVK